RSGGRPAGRSDRDQPGRLDRPSQVRPLPGGARRGRPGVHFRPSAQPAVDSLVARRAPAGAHRPPGGPSAVSRRGGALKRGLALADPLAALALVAWVGGHAALGAFAARILFRDLPRPIAAPAMTTIFRSFDQLILAALGVLALATLVRRFSVG